MVSDLEWLDVECRTYQPAFWRQFQIKHNQNNVTIKFLYPWHQNRTLTNRVREVRANTHTQTHTQPLTLNH